MRLKRLLTCPNSAHLEAVEVELEEDGARIERVLRCSAFEPDCAVGCDQRCTRLLNRKLAAAREAATADDDPDPAPLFA